MCVCVCVCRIVQYTSHNCMVSSAVIMYREFPNREVATHIVLNNLSTVTVPNLATMVSSI